jgi:hypothetical protein
MRGSQTEHKSRIDRIQAETAQTQFLLVFGHGLYDHDYGITISIHLGIFNSEE